MAKAEVSQRNLGPAIRAVEPWVSSTGCMRQLLTDEERARLAVIASIARFKKGAVIYREGDNADAIFNIIAGVVAASRRAPDGSEHIAAFLFPDDLFGLSEEGRYTNSTRALTAVTAYRLPVSVLSGRLAKDANLEFHVICKLCQELRQAQRHAFLLSQRRAVAKLVMLLQFLQELQAARSGGEQGVDIYLPMSRSEIGEYAGMTLAAVSRAFRSLVTRGVIKLQDRRHVSIIDRGAFERIAAESDATRVESRSAK